MDIIKFLDGFTTDKLTARMSSRRGALATLGIFGAQALMAAAPCLITLPFPYYSLFENTITRLRNYLFMPELPWM